MSSVESGICSPEAVKVYYYEMETESGQLMLSELKSRPWREPSYSAAVHWSAYYAWGVKPFSSERLNFPGMIYFDVFTFTKLKRNTGNYTVCHKDLCCHLTYKMSEKRNSEVYPLGAFDSLHMVEGQYYLQVETLRYVRMALLLICLLGHHCISLRIVLDSVNWNGVTFVTELFSLEHIICSVLVRTELERKVKTGSRLISSQQTGFKFKKLQPPYTLFFCQVTLELCFANCLQLESRARSPFHIINKHSQDVWLS